MPLVKTAGVDLIHFGIILTTNLGLGTYTPPIAPNIWTTQSLFNVPLSRILPGLVPFIALHLVVDILKGGSSIQRPAPAKVAAIVSLLLWAGVISCGRLLPYL